MNKTAQVFEIMMIKQKSDIKFKLFKFRIKVEKRMHPITGNGRRRTIVKKKKNI